ncbi:MAG: HAAS signaling domain-containing protein [Acidimicrobiales bacterium]
MRRGADPSAELGAVECEYLAHLDALLRDLPAQHREELIAQAAEHLAERPPAGHTQDLWKAVGSPSVYAAALRSIPPAAGATRAERAVPVRHSRRRRMLASAMLLVLLVGLGLAVREVRAIDPPVVLNACSGVSAQDATVEEILFMTEYTVQYRQNGSFWFSLCPFSEADGVTLRAVRLPVLPDSILQPAGLVEIRAMGDVDVRADPESGFAIELSELYGLSFHVEFDNCEVHIGRSSQWWSAVEIEVDRDGQSFTMPLPLDYVVTVENTTRDICPRDDARHAAFMEAIGPVDDRAQIAGRDLCRFFEGVDTEQELAERALFDLPTEQRADVARAAFAADCPDEAEHLDQVLELVDP